MRFRLLCLVFLFPMALSAETPTLQQTTEEAVRHAGLSQVDDRWSGRARWSALLPKIDISVGEDRDDDFRTKEKSNFFRDDSDALLHEWTQSEVARNRDSSTDWSVRATWDLSDLVFHKSELQAESRAEKRRRMRLEIEDRIAVLFSRWWHLRRYASTPELRFERLTIAAQLNAATGGWFLQETQP